jgi:XRE family aerobic/anaerobic benzoate catabolism transcriptional regulator
MPAPVPDDRLLATVGERVRDLRARRGLTLRALASASGLSVRFLGQIEAGRGNVSILKLAELAAALSTTPAALLSARRAAPPLVCLLGLRGAGKTTIGRRLARRLRIPFVELDRRVEEMAGLALPEIFSIHGEEYYRRLERQTLERVLAEERALVLAAGGGIVTSPEAFALLRQRTATFWLRATVQDHWARVLQQGDRRPLTGQDEAMSELRRLMAAREPLYMQAAHTIDTTRLGVEGAVRAIEARLRRAAPRATKAAAGRG